MDDEEAHAFYDVPENREPTEGDPVRRPTVIARDLPRDKFPVTIVAFGPKHEIVFVRCVQDAGVITIPGLGPGSVRRVLMVFGDGTYVDEDQGT